MDSFLGVDIGGSKSHALIADASGRVLGFAQAGPGNWEDVGFDGMAATLAQVTKDALSNARLTSEQIAGAGFGLAGYDWESQRQVHLDAIHRLGLAAPFELVNDTIIGLIAGSAAGWGIAIVAGTRANCWGWDQAHRIARMTGYGTRMAEGAGGLELVGKAVQAVSLAWSRRGPPTRLTRDFIQWTGARDEDDLIEGLSLERIRLDAAAAPVVFRAAEQGDLVALETVIWAGRELGSLAVGVIRQLRLEAQVFDAVLVGSLYRGSPLLLSALRATVQPVAPGANFVPLQAPPVVGGVLLGMQAGGRDPASVRATLLQCTNELVQYPSG